MSELIEAWSQKAIHVARMKKMNARKRNLVLVLPPLVGKSELLKSSVMQNLSSEYKFCPTGSLAERARWGVSRGSPLLPPPLQRAYKLIKNYSFGDHPFLLFCFKLKIKS